MKHVAVLAAALLTLWCVAAAPAAHADVQCQYPMVGILAVSVGGIGGGFCDGPTEVNGSHWHCQGGGVNLGLGGSLLGIGGTGNVGIVGVGQGIHGISCSWKCADGADAPAPNPPGAWQHYLVPMNTTNFCKDHMTPNGFWSAPVLPTEGIPPADEIAPQPGETLPPQPTPAPQPSAIPTVTPSPPPIPGEPNALEPAPGEPNP